MADVVGVVRMYLVSGVDPNVVGILGSGRGWCWGGIKVRGCHSTVIHQDVEV